MNNPAYWRLYYKVQGALIREFGDNRSYTLTCISITSDLLKGEVPTDDKFQAIADRIAA